MDTKPDYSNTNVGKIQKKMWNAYYECIINNTSLILHSCPVISDWMTAWKWALGMSHCGKSKGRGRLPEQLIPYASKHSIMLEENPDPICGGRVNDQLISLHGSQNSEKFLKITHYKFQNFAFIVLYRFIVFIKWTNIILGMTIHSSSTWSSYCFLPTCWYDWIQTTAKMKSKLWSKITGNWAAQAFPF